MKKSIVSIFVLGWNEEENVEWNEGHQNRKLNGMNLQYVYLDISSGKLYSKINMEN